MQCQQIDDKDTPDINPVYLQSNIAELLPEVN